jgi:hypothetical protein
LNSSNDKTKTERNLERLSGHCLATAAQCITVRDAEANQSEPNAVVNVNILGANSAQLCLVKPQPWASVNHLLHRLQIAAFMRYLEEVGWNWVMRRATGTIFAAEWDRLSRNPHQKTSGRD